MNRYPLSADPEPVPDLQAELAASLRRHRGLRGHPAIPVPTTVPERTAARFAGPTITPEETP